MTAWRAMPQQLETVMFVGGRVHVMDGATPAQDALVIRGGRVLAVGPEAAMRALAGRDAHTIDVQGATVMPGLVDTHPHVLHFAARQRAVVDITGARDHADIVARIRATTARTPAGQWIQTTPVGEPHFFIRRSYRDLAEGRLPDRHLLDQATSDHPVFIQAWGPTTPNICAFNSRGLRAIGVNDLVPDRVSDVWIEKDERGALTGIFRGAVNNYYNIDPYWTQILARMPGPASWELHDSTIAGMAEANRHGVTTIYEPHNMSRAHVETYARLRQEQALTVRVMTALEVENYAYPPHWPLSMDAFREQLEVGRSLIDNEDDYLRMNGLTFSPGTPCGPGLVRMHEPYRGPFGALTRGVSFLSPEKQRAFIDFCAEHDVRANFCTAGYRDHDDLLDDLETVADRYRLPERRWLIQHALVISERQAQRYAALGCVLTTSMAFSWGKGDLWGERVGPDVWRDQVPLKRLLRAGLVVGAGSDWGPKNPWEQMQLAETHEFAGSGRRNATPDHAVTREEALAMWTRDAGRVMGWDGVGTLAPGSHADVIAVDRDPLTCGLDELPQTTVLLTLLGGRVVHDAGTLDARGAR
jgi:predicted amidohydrolase YtcJ